MNSKPSTRDRNVAYPAWEYKALWDRTGDPRALLAWGDALARDRALTLSENDATVSVVSSKSHPGARASAVRQKGGSRMSGVSTPDAPTARITSGTRSGGF